MVEENRLGALEYRIVELETKLRPFGLSRTGRLANFSSGSCTNECTAACTIGCTSGCTGGCVSGPEEITQMQQQPAAQFAGVGVFEKLAGRRIGS